MATQRSGASAMFVILLAGAAVFIWLTSGGLPEIVASHFVASGAANGFMPRRFYVGFMLVFVVALPSALVFLPAANLNKPNARINLPNREYWLAPERRAETLEVLHAYMARIGSMLVIFLSYVHWLVVRANTLVPPRMSKPWIIGGLVVFGVCTLLWAWALVGRFRDVPQ